MENRDQLRLEVIAEMESIDWPSGYEIVDIIDLPAQFYFEGPNNFGGSTGRYGYQLDWPADATGPDRYRAIDAVLTETGDYEGYETNIDSLTPCEEFSSRSYVHMPTGNVLYVRYDMSSEPPGALFEVLYSYNPDGSPSARSLDRLDPRPGDPCAYP